MIGRFSRRGKTRGGSHDWLSRDTKHIDCKAVGCVYNREEQCMVPTKCNIGDDGRCTGFEASKLKKILDGD